MFRSRRLDDAVIVLTGASSGIGRACAFAFARHRTRLVLVARGESALDEVASRCRESGARVVTVPVDLTTRGSESEVATKAVEAFGRIDVWVNAAAVLVAGELTETPEDELRRLLAVNVIATVLASRAALARFEQQGRGTLINVSSMLALIPNPLVPAYVASKAAIRGLTLALHESLRARPGIRACVVLPGPVDTPMFEHAANHTGRGLRAIPPAYAPERLAAAIVRCARRPRRQVTTGVLARSMFLAHRIAPGLVERILAAWSKRFLLRPTPAPSSTGTLDRPNPTGRVHGDWRLGSLRRRLGEAWGRRLAG